MKLGQFVLVAFFLSAGRPQVRHVGDVRDVRDVEEVGYVGDVGDVQGRSRTWCEKCSAGAHWTILLNWENPTDETLRFKEGCQF